MRIVQSINFEINAGTDVVDATQVASTLSHMNGNAPVTFKHNGTRYTVIGHVVAIKERSKKVFEMRKQWLEETFEGYIIARAK